MNYGKENLKKQIRFFSSKAVKKKTRAAVIAFKVFLAAAAGLFAVAVSIGVGMFRGILRSAPDLATLNMSPTATATILYDSDGNEIETLVMAGSNRKPVDYSELPEDLINAFVAIEDERFWTHKGVDVKGLARAVYSGLTSGSLDEGASTITQQLIKNVAFDGGMEQTFGDRVKR